MTGYDVIGDVHGYADRLVNLLRNLGYYEKDGSWRPPVDRTAVFVGDLIDRGEQQLETIGIVRSMVDAGNAHIVMGNHEYNAIAYDTTDPASSEYCRPHSKKNNHQHEAFLGEVGFGTPLHRRIIEWFMEMPLWLDLGEIRIVHACWSEEHMADLKPLLTATEGAWKLTEEAVVTSSERESDPYLAVESLLKGPEIPIDGYHYSDKDGNRRERARIRWWARGATTLRDLAIIPDGCELRAPDGTEAEVLPTTVLEATPVQQYEDSTPVFVGHYWETGVPEPLDRRIACVDYSAGKGGPLVAYRWDGEETLDSAKFIAG